MANAAKILRWDILDHWSRFDGTFHEGCIKDSIPPLLFQVIGMVGHRTDIKSQLIFGNSRTDQAIAQLLQYNSYSRYKEGAATHRHSKDKETPFSLYTGMSVYTKNRKRSLIEMLQAHGKSISYDWVLEISAQLGDATITTYVEEGVVCPSMLWRGLFTTAAMNNIDHNPSATTATTSFHGLLEIPAGLYSWDLHHISRPRTNHWCHHHSWFSFGPHITTKNIKDLWGLLSTRFCNCNTCLSQEVKEYTLCLWCVQSIKPWNGKRSKWSQGGWHQVTNKNKIPLNLHNSPDITTTRQTSSALWLARLLTWLKNMVVVTKGLHALSTSEISPNSLDQCFHKEADSQIFVHARHATEEDSKAIMIKANDTDVLVITLSIFPSLQDLSLQQLCVAFGHS